MYVDYCRNDPDRAAFAPSRGSYVKMVLDWCYKMFHSPHTHP